MPTLQGEPTDGVSEAEVVSAHASHINHWPLIVLLLLLQDWTSDVATKSLFSCKYRCCRGDSMARRTCNNSVMDRCVDRQVRRCADWSADHSFCGCSKKHL